MTMHFRRLGLFLAAGLSAVFAQAAPVGFTDAAQQGSFNIGAAQASLSREFEGDPLNRDLLVIDFSIPEGTAAGVWAKGYPESLAAGAADALELGVYLPQQDAPAVAAEIELKGASGTQRIPVRLLPGWNLTRELIDWEKTGPLSETVLLIRRTGGEGPAAGRIRVDLVFQSLPRWEKWRATLWGRAGGIAVFSALSGLLVAVLRQKRKVAVRGFSRDLMAGGCAVLMLTSALCVYFIGRMSPLQSGWLCFYVAVAGVLIGLGCKLLVAGRPVFAGEAMRGALIPGLFAAAAGRGILWQAPDSLDGFVQLSGFGAALFTTVFHAANLVRLHQRRRLMGWIGSAVVLAVPFVFGLLLALQSFHQPAVQALLVFCAGEFVANAASLVSRERPLFSLKIHRALLMLSILVVAAPYVADLGSGRAVAALPGAVRPAVAVVAVMVSQAPLWGLVYLLTALVLGAMRGNLLSGVVGQDEALRGMKKGMVFGGVLMGLLQFFHLLTEFSLLQAAFRLAPAVLWPVAGALAFPLLKTVVETFDGSRSFFARAACAFRDPVLYLRGLVAGIAVARGLQAGFPDLPAGARIVYGAAAGAASFGGVSLLRDVLFGLCGTGGVKSWRYYLVEAALGSFIGAGVGFYLDAAQLPLMAAKFELYNSFGLDPSEVVLRCQQLRTTAPHEFTALISRWGHIRLSPACGGARILFNEALMGVIGWGIAAPLFAVNKAFLQALLNRDFSPVRRISTREGILDLADGTVYVLRWGLWMAPLIFSFLRPMAEASWYNQDGLIRTCFAVFNSLTRDASGFTAWSLTVFGWIIGYAWFQVAIWIDHMGLRVATLVNLSFLGVDRLDERCAAFVGPDATARFIPEGVKRFTTWAPLLIPFYLPKGAQWEQVFTAGTAIQAKQAALVPGWSAVLATAGIALPLFTALFALRRTMRQRHLARSAPAGRLVNNRYAVELRKNGELNSMLTSSGIGISRCSFEQVDPAGRILFLLEEGAGGAANRVRPVIGNFPKEQFSRPAWDCDGDRLQAVSLQDGIRLTVTIRLPGRNDPVELWEIVIEELSGRARKLKVVPYLEWMLSRPDADRNHTQYNRLYPEMSFQSETNALLAVHRQTKICGLLASEKAPEGILTGRVDFIGRAGNVWSPRALQTLAFREALDTDPCPSFDPAGTLLLDATLSPGGRVSHRILIGGCAGTARAAELICKYLQPQRNPAARGIKARLPYPVIGHGEIPDGVSSPYCEYADGGNTLVVRTPFTPRPFDHEMANPSGHVVAVTNRGLHSSASGNSQQNRVTPDRPDLTGSQVPSEAIYLYDPESGEWFSPCFNPLKDLSAVYESRFSLDGSAEFFMRNGDLETRLSVHVPLDEPAGVYILTLYNRRNTPRRVRMAPYFQIALAQSPEQAGSLQTRFDQKEGALYFENPRNRFRSGTCFAAISAPVELAVERRDRFFGAGRPFERPFLVEAGQAAPPEEDAFPAAALMTTLEIPPGGERTVVVVLGEADSRRKAQECIRRLCSADRAHESLQATRRWWLALQSTLKVETADPEFDAYVKWMKYQTLGERIWARKGFYQASGAYGFRDQLQDAVNLIWVDPSLARAQLLLHAAQQFPEGDVAHWFFLQQDGRTGFLSRSYASDNLLWLGWGVGEYIRMTGDETLLDEKAVYLKAETPLEPLPAGKHGMGFFPLRSPRSDSIYRHVLRAVDLVLEKRLGCNGLPLMGTGDWNDGLDEIGSRGRGESVWLGFFLICVLKNLLPVIGAREGGSRRSYYEQEMLRLGRNIEKTWRGDRYLRAIHDDGTEIGVEGAGFWETDALNAAWAVFAGMNPERSRIALDTALRVLERDKVICLGWPALRADSKPYLGRSSTYPEGVRENGMYAHGVQWLTRACRIVSQQLAAAGNCEASRQYRDAAVRIWYKVSAIPHARGEEIEIYGGQPNKQCADYLTVHDPGRMIWSGYTGAAGWMLRQACEAVAGATLENNRVILPDDFSEPRGGLSIRRLERDLAGSPLLDLKV